MVKTSYSFKQEARRGELLVLHTTRTAFSCQKKMRSVRSLLGLSPDFLQNVAYLIGLGHDLGKATSFFQRRLANPNLKGSVTYHSELSALITWDLVRQYGSQMRMTRGTVDLLGALAYLVVCRHHGAIGNVEDLLEEDLDKYTLQKQLEALDVAEVLAIVAESDVPVNYHLDKDALIKLRKDSWKAWDKFLDHLNLPLYYLHKLLFSILVASDKGSVILKDKAISSKQIPGSKVLMVEKFKESLPKTSKLDLMREELYQAALSNVEKPLNPLLSLNMPTGTGKTLTSLAAAYKIKELLNKSGPIIYCLPFTSIIDQNHQIFSDVMERYQGKLPTSNQLLKHHYLASRDYLDSDQEWNPDQSRFLVESWESELVVTTFVQLFYTLTGNGNRQLLKLYRMKDAVVILDEVQAIPVKYWGFVRAVLQAAIEELQCHIILVTATLPLIFAPGEVTNLISEPQTYFKKVNRTKIKLHLNQSLTLQDFYPKLEQLIRENEQKDILVVLNTIQSAAQVYAFLKKRAYPRDYLYLSTYVAPKERVERLQQLKDKKPRPKFIITTQLIEAGVDLDVGLVIRDFGPLDAINQVAGRCNRYWEREGAEEVHIFRLLNEKGQDFASMVYDPALLLATEECLKNVSEVMEQDYWELSNQYFEKLRLKRLEVDTNLIKLAERLEHDAVAQGFKLMEDLPKIPVFIQLDERSEELWQRYLVIIREKHGWKQREAFGKFKREFLEYVINVAEKDAKGLSWEEDFYLVPRDKLNTSYHPETGFIKKE